MDPEPMAPQSIPVPDGGIDPYTMIGLFATAVVAGIGTAFGIETGLGGLF